jgi:hypothetical protein
MKQIITNKIVRLISLIFLTYMVAYWLSYVSLSSAVNQEINKIKQHAEIYSLIQIISPIIDSKTNAAPYYQKALKNIPAFDFSFYCNSYVTIQKYLAEHKKEVTTKLTQPEYNQIFIELKESYTKPKCRFDVNYEKIFQSYNLQTDIGLIHYAGAIPLCQFMAVKAANEIEDNKIALALDSCVYALRFTRNLYQGTLQGSSMYPLAIIQHCLNINYYPIMEMAARGVKADYRKIISEINLLLREQNNGFYRALQNQRVLDLFFFKSKDMNLNFINFFFRARCYYSIPQQLYWFAIYKFAKQPFILCNELFYLRYMGEALNAVKENKNFDWNLNKIPKPYMILCLMFRTPYKEIFDHQNQLMSDFQQLLPKLELLNTGWSDVNLPGFFGHTEK